MAEVELKQIQSELKWPQLMNDWYVSHRKELITKKRKRELHYADVKSSSSEQNDSWMAISMLQLMQNGVRTAKLARHKIQKIMHRVENELYQSIQTELDEDEQEIIEHTMKTVSSNLIKNESDCCSRSGCTVKRASGTSCCMRCYIDHDTESIRYKEFIKVLEKKLGLNKEDHIMDNGPLTYGRWRLPLRWAREKKTPICLFCDKTDHCTFHGSTEFGPVGIDVVETKKNGIIIQCKYNEQSLDGKKRLYRSYDHVLMSHNEFEAQISAALSLSC